jgi:hypothetical protein
MNFKKDKFNLNNGQKRHGQPCTPDPSLRNSQYDLAHINTMQQHGRRKKPVSHFLKAI